MAFIIPLNVDISPKSIPLEVETPIVQSTNYDDLHNKPKLNGITIEGDHNSEYYGLDKLDKTYVHHQDIASTEWTIHHNLNKYPSVTVVDSAGTHVVGCYRYVDINTVICTFSGAFGGVAYLN